MNIPSTSYAKSIDYWIAIVFLFEISAAIETTIVHTLMCHTRKYRDLANNDETIRRQSYIRHEKLARHHLTTKATASMTAAINGRLFGNNDKPTSTSVGGSSTGTPAAVVTTAGCCYESILSERFRQQSDNYSIYAARVDLVARLAFPFAFSLIVILYTIFCALL